MNSKAGILKSRAFILFAVVVLLNQVCLAKYCGGSGTAEDPYQICSAEALLALAADANDYDANFVLTADIDLAGHTFTTAVIARNVNNLNNYYDGNSFSGIFDGAGHIIKNLTIDTNGTKGIYLGLFGLIRDGQVKNLGLHNAFIRSGDNSTCVGVLAGASSADINCCFSTGSIIGGDSCWEFGGLAGNSDHISNSFSTVDITSGDSSDGIGGLAGFCGEIDNSYSTGDITAGDKSTDIGGLAGFCDDGAVRNCYAAGNIISGRNSQYIGGLMGYFYIDTSGGVVIVTTGSTDSMDTLAKSVDSSYGYDLTENCYFLINKKYANGLGKPLTAKQMKQRANFAGWDFVGTWMMFEGLDYPKLAWAFDGTHPLAVTKFTVTDRIESASIYVSGLMGATNDDFTNADVIEVSLSATTFGNLPWVLSFPITTDNYKNGIFRGVVPTRITISTREPVGKSGVDDSEAHLNYNVKTHKFEFYIKDTSLRGLSCPVTFSIRIGELFSKADIDETIVNGPKKPIPISLLMGVTDSLRVDKTKFTHNKSSGNITQIAISGGLSIYRAYDLNLVTIPLNLTIGSKTFTIPANTFKNKNWRFTCSKVVLDDGETAASVFDLQKGDFKLTIKNTKITDPKGTADFKMVFGEFSEGATVSLP